MGKIVATIRQVIAGLSGRVTRKKQARPAGQGQSRSMTKPKANASFPGAVTRGLLTAGLVMLPAVMVPSTSAESAQMMVLLALFAGVFVFIEYCSDYPGMIEFRFAAPFNRTRFLLIAVMVLSLSLLARAGSPAEGVAGFAQVLAASCAQVLDFAFSPVRLLVAALPGSVPETHLLAVQHGASLALVLGLTTVVAFWVAIRLNLWPMGPGPFNVWINLPMFDPTAGSDVVARLLRTAKINILLGILLPFLLPGIIMASAVLVQPLSLESPVGFVWGIALWAFVPVSLIMRGIAMLRVARMIRANRRQFIDTESSPLATA